MRIFIRMKKFPQGVETIPPWKLYIGGVSCFKSFAISMQNLINKKIFEIL